MLKNFEFIKKITEAHGPAGFEDEVRDIIKEELKNVCTQFDYDNLGSIICELSKNKNLKVAIMAHMDEVGFLVERITKEGNIKVYNLGGIDPILVQNNILEIKTYFGKKIKGILSSETSSKETKIEDLYIDIGCRSLEEVKEMGVEIGNSISFTTETKYLDENNLVSKSWDDRVGCILAVELLKDLKKEKLEYELYFIGTVQEEIGTRGGKTAINKLQPDIIINLDVATAKKNSDNTRTYGKGPCLVVADKLALGNKVLLREVVEISKRIEAKYQLDFLKGGGTDNGPGSNSGNGIPGISIILPVKNCHTPYTVINEEDYKECYKILKEFLLNIDEKILDKIYYYKK
ncbi:M20/M25/M40 family metallo-hydrolase [uncultured Cetobacterium sp.]|uniref:M42 family metallopeptidase n=1 Tax=uncultured Cetobacterium sp. TaxID=527638 RepID=UPI0025F258A0|nr:M20/M25/M40 family metallo-hydrolase [uncultured Cetobacterium sp.]